MAADALLLAVAAIITAIGGLIGALTLGARHLAEARRTRDSAEETAAQFRRNGGSTMVDAIDRLEQGVAHIAHEQRSQRDELVALHRSSDTIHQQLSSRIQHLETPPPPPGVEP